MSASCIIWVVLDVELWGPFLDVLYVGATAEVVTTAFKRLACPSKGGRHTSRDEGEESC